MTKQYRATRLKVAAFLATNLAFGLSCAQGALFANAPGSPLASNGGPVIAAVGEATRDGRLDLLIAYSSRPSVGVLVGRGDGTFTESSAGRMAVPFEPTEMAAGDLNGDGLIDAVVANHDSYDVVVLLADGDGGFQPSPRVVATKQGHHAHTHGLAVADVNGDNHLDILAVNHEDGDMSVLLGDGTGAFKAAEGSPFAAGERPYPLGVGDLNGDGRVDVAIPNTSSSSGGHATLLIGDGAGGFSRQGTELRTPRPWYAVVADLDGDGRAEVVFTHWERSRTSVVTSKPGSSWNEVAGSPFDPSAAAYAAVVADFDGDGNPDFAGAAGEVVGVMVGDGEGAFRPAAGSPFRIEKSAWRIATGDLNGDGKNDLVTANTESNTVSILLAR